MKTAKMVEGDVRLKCLYFQFDLQRGLYKISSVYNVWKLTQGHLHTH